MFPGEKSIFVFSLREKRSMRASAIRAVYLGRRPGLPEAMRGGVHLGMVLGCCLFAGCGPQTGAAFEYPLRGTEVMRSTVHSGRMYADVTKLVEDKYADIEERWRQALPIAGGSASSTPISEWPVNGRGQFAERRDYTLNRQPGAPALSGPRSDTRENFPIDGNLGGNFCDEGSVDTHCIVHRELLFPGNFTLSGQGRTPFARTAFCSCKALGCACTAELGDFLPEFADLSWASLSVEVERSGVQVGHPGALVKQIKVDDALLRGQCNPPRLCAHGAPSESLEASGPPECNPICGEWHACAVAHDVSHLAIDGHLAVTVQSGNWNFRGGTCDGNVLHVRVRLEGEYTGHGTLDVRAGGGIFCVSPACVIKIQDFRTVSFREGSRVATDSLEITIPRVHVDGVVEANRVKITAGALNISMAGAILNDDTKRHSRADIDVRPGSVSHDAKFLPEGCHANCFPCSCFIVDGRIQMTRIVLTGLSLQLGACRVSAQPPCLPMRVCSRVISRICVTFCTYKRVFNA